MPMLALIEAESTSSAWIPLCFAYVNCHLGLIIHIAKRKIIYMFGKKL